MYHSQPPWHEITEPALLRLVPDEIRLGDHLNGFDRNQRNHILDLIDAEAARRRRSIMVSSGYVPVPEIEANYPNLRLSYWNTAIMEQYFWGQFRDYSPQIAPSFQHFLCSFNGSPHVGRQLLTAALHRRGWYDASTVTKNFSTSRDQIDGHIRILTSDDAYWRKFFIGVGSDEFFAKQNSIDYQQFNHRSNAEVLEPAIMSSFLHLVSETMATSYQPFVTEKFLHSIVTRGLFVAYAQPGWHDHLERYWGFRLYRRIFDYSFDAEPNPVQRLIRLLDMLSRFADLDSADWQDLYQQEIDNIEYNHAWFSGSGLSAQMAGHCRHD